METEEASSGGDNSNSEPAAAAAPSDAEQKPAESDSSNEKPATEVRLCVGFKLIKCLKVYFLLSQFSCTFSSSWSNRHCTEQIPMDCA